MALKQPMVKVGTALTIVAIIMEHQEVLIPGMVVEVRLLQVVMYHPVETVALAMSFWYLS